MDKTLTVRQLTLGDGTPKVCVPLTDTHTESLVWSAVLAKAAAADLVEWRADYHKDVLDATVLLRAAKTMRTALQHTPLLFTLRTKGEGGQQQIERSQYIQTVRAIITGGYADLVDIELSLGEERIAGLLEEAHSKGIKVVVSSHNFKCTPTREAMLHSLQRMRALGADIPKLAVMPENFGDVLRLLAATEEFYQRSDCPAITMSMGQLGQLSRVAGRFTGSAVTFGVVEEASAPGQLPVQDLRRVLEILGR